MDAPLRVDETSLSGAAAGCAELATKLATANPTPEPGTSWLATSDAVTTVRADSETFRKTMAARLRDTAADLTKAGAAYASTDGAAASNLDAQVV